MNSKIDQFKDKNNACHGVLNVLYTYTNAQFVWMYSSFSYHISKWTTLEAKIISDQSHIQTYRSECLV